MAVTMAGRGTSRCDQSHQSVGNTVRGHTQVSCALKERSACRVAQQLAGVEHIFDRQVIEGAGGEEGSFGKKLPARAPPCRVAKVTQTCDDRILCAAEGSPDRSGRQGGARQGRTTEQCIVVHVRERAAAASNSQKEVDVRVHQRLAWRYCAPVEQFGERRQCPLTDH
jgi:hypothetical protein